MTEQGMEILAEMTWPPESSGRGRAAVVRDQEGNRFLSLGKTYFFPLEGYEQMEPEACLNAAPLAGMLAGLERAGVEFGAGALLVGQGPLADLWLRLLGWRGCVPVHRVDSLVLEMREQEAAAFLEKVERPIVAVEASGDGTAVETLVRLLRRGDRLLLAGSRESGVTIYAYRDIHKKGISIIGVDSSLAGSPEGPSIIGETLAKALRLMARDQ
ncbi:MAG: hypothetical protein K9K66_10925 [Desulfarculaceae bacterium]|nr:hypothetical protein [Desulfarculaceae bacterium]MCF8118295.1 hypothetical protein [Desulfarculaceae bacterium]